jgi:hypothetical protein
VESELNIGKNPRWGNVAATDEMHMWKRRFPYEQYNKWSRDAAEKRRWTEALEKWGPKRVEEKLSSRVLGSSASMNIAETRGVVVGFARDWLAWREQNQVDWTMWAVIIGFVMGIAAIGVSISLN